MKRWGERSKEEREEGVWRVRDREKREIEGSQKRGLNTGIVRRWKSETEGREKREIEYREK